MIGNKPPTSEIIQRAAKLDLPVQEDSIQPDYPVDLGEDLGEQRSIYEIDTLKQQLVESKDNHQLRIGYANKIFCLVCVWLACVVISLLLTGFHTTFFLWSGTGFLLSDKVLITFITTTTVNVIGIFIIVAKWMYPNDRNSNTNHKK